MTGIYTIVHVPSGRTYVGSSADTDWRFYQHRWYLNRGTHNNKRLQRAWSRDGADAFVWAVVEECPVESLLMREQAHLDQRQPLVYNIGHFVHAVTRGCVPSAETRRKLSEANKGRPHSPAHRAKLTAANKARAGWKHTDAAKAAVSLANTGRVRTQAHRDAISRAQTGSTRNIGQIVSKETRQKISEALTGRIHSPETRAKMSATKRALDARRIYAAEFFYA